MIANIKNGIKYSVCIFIVIFYTSIPIEVIK